MSDFFDDALEKMDEGKDKDEAEAKAEEWEPKSEGETLRGIFLKATRKKTDWGVGFTVIVRDIDTGLAIKVWCKRSMLKSQLLSASPAKGSPIVFKYNGTIETSNGYEMHSYQIRAEKSDPKYWAGITKPSPEELIPTPKPEVTNFGPDEAPY